MLREVANGLQNSSRSNSISETTSEQIEPTNRNSSSEGNKVDEEEEKVVADDATTKDDKEGMEKRRKEIRTKRAGKI